MSAAKRTPEATSALRASLLTHALEIVREEGANALTMRALAARAGCALGLPYKVFGSRGELVEALVDAYLQQLVSAMNEFVASAGTRSVSENLDQFADVLLRSDTEVIRLADIRSDPILTSRLDEAALRSGFIAGLATAVPRYLAAEKKLGRIGNSVDEEAIGFLITGAIHNLVVSGEGYPRPGRGRLREHLTGVARLLR